VKADYSEEEKKIIFNIDHPAKKEESKPAAE
jgi:hypothetical protein